jgi:hypothetical protein
MLLLLRALALLLNRRCCSRGGSLQLLACCLRGGA